MLAFLLSLCFGLVWLVPFAPAPSSYAVPWLVSGFAGGAALICAGINRLDRTDIVRAVAWGCLSGGLISALIGLAQYNGIAAHWAELTQGWVNPGHTGEAYGHLRQRNLFATLTNIALACLAYLIVTQAPSSAALPRLSTCVRGLGYVIATLLLISANVASSSRTGMIQLWFLCLLVIILGLTRRISRGWLGVGMLTLFSWGLCLWLVPRLLNSNASTTALDRMAESGGCENRLVLWFNVLELISQKPWLGWGWGELDWAHHMATYQWAAFGGPHRFCALLDNAHNLLLHTAVEGGLVLAGAFALGCGWLVFKGTPWRETDASRVFAWIVLMLIGFHSMLEYPLWYGPFVITTLFCLLMLVPNQFFAPLDRIRLGSRLLGTSVLCLCAYLTWDYHRVGQYFLPAEQRNPWTEHKPLAQADPSWMFQSQLDFARLVTLNITPENAAQAQQLALRVMHYSPEPRVIEQLLTASRWAGDAYTHALHQARYAQAYPQAYALWRKSAAASRE